MDVRGCVTLIGASVTCLTHGFMSEDCGMVKSLENNRNLFIINVIIPFMQNTCHKRPNTWDLICQTQGKQYHTLWSSLVGNHDMYMQTQKYLSYTTYSALSRPLS